MEMNQCMLAESIMQTRFACVDLQIYLDTHPDDAMAKSDFISYARKLSAMLERYEAQYGPLLNFGASATDAGSWVYSKWPWDL